MADRIAQIAGQLNYPKGLLAGQVAIITGAAQGIGAEVARLFANEGAKVVISDIDAAKSKEVADKINAGGGKALAVAGDLLKDECIKELIKKAAEFGGGKIHIIVNNAGFTWDGVIHKVSTYLSPTPCSNRGDIVLIIPPRHIDDGQTMGHHDRPPRHRPLQTGPRGSPFLPRQRR